MCSTKKSKNKLYYGCRQGFPVYRNSTQLKGVLFLTYGTMCKVIIKRSTFDPSITYARLAVLGENMKPGILLGALKISGFVGFFLGG